MLVDWRIEPLRRDHDRAGFGCGEPELDEYLARFARQNQESARLAVASTEHGKGLGDGLLFDALSRCLHVAKDVGIIAVIVDAKHERAKSFYSRYEFDALPDQPLTLWMPLPVLRKLLIPTLGAQE